MLRDTHGKIILDTLLSKVKININDPKQDPLNKLIKFDDGKPIYIGLLNVLPTPNHELQYDPDSSIPYYFREPGPAPGSTYNEYIRIRIDTNSQLNNIFLLSNATYDDSTGEVYVTNVDSILFPEALESPKMMEPEKAQAGAIFKDLVCFIQLIRLQLIQKTAFLFYGERLKKPEQTNPLRLMAAKYLL